MEKEVLIEKVYRHFKGNYYYVVDVAYDSETKERMVIYKPLYEREEKKCFGLDQKKCFCPKFQKDQIILQDKRQDSLYAKI